MHIYMHVGAGPGSAAYETFAGADADAAPRIAFLDAQCAPRATCREGGDAYARALCDRSFAVDVLASPFLHRRALTLGAVAGCGADATNATDAAAGREPRVLRQGPGLRRADAVAPDGAGASLGPQMRVR